MPHQPTLAIVNAHHRTPRFFIFPWWLVRWTQNTIVRSDKSCLPFVGMGCGHGEAQNEHLWLWVPARARLTLAWPGRQFYAFSSASTVATAGRASLRLRCATTLGSFGISTPAPSSPPEMV